MKILNSSSDLIDWRKNLPSSSVVGFVPTMGALHSGHLSLIKTCVDHSDISIVSIFLNPKQFSENEDFDSYPQNINLDLKKLEKLNIDAVFIPSVNDIYGGGDTFILKETSLSLKLEGESRPHFFNGVLTVVAKLFNLVVPSKTFFGQKDAQQLILIKKMVADMKYSIDVIACPTIREKNGLAMSSRNEYLTKRERGEAQIIYKSLIEAKNAFYEKNIDAQDIKHIITKRIQSNNNIKIDYVSVSNIPSLEDVVGKITNSTLVSVAVYIRNVRLIDNLVLEVKA